MKLSVLERINLMGILPVESNFITMKILTELKSALSFSEKEIKDFKIEQKQVGEVMRIFWDTKKEKEKEIPIGDQANIIIQNALKKIDKEGKVTEGIYPLFERFRYFPDLEVKN
jgi:predicted Holliday junction resolvase-like endonuclease